MHFNFHSFITFLRTDDLEKTTNFYVNIMKCKLIVDQGLCKIFQTTNSAFLGFCSHEFLKKENEGICLTFVCSSMQEVDEWFQYLKENKVEIKDEPKVNEKFKIYNFFAYDPNKITLEIQYFLDPFP
ncbi:MAG: VOC family protein [Candidatus Thorarchaeota archaeon]